MLEGGGAASDPAQPGRRAFLKAGTLALAGTLLPLPGRGGVAPGGSRPNLLILFTDDQNPYCVGYASSGRLITPNLDRLAGRGTIFDAAYAAAIPCVPSRGCFMTGLHYDRVKKNHLRRLIPGEWTWAHALRQAGYRTAMIGKMHFQPMRARHGFEHAEYCEQRAYRIPSGAEDDFERWLRENGVEGWHGSGRGTGGLWHTEERYHPISWARDRAIAYLEEQKQHDAPFCLLVSFRHPHTPFNPTKRFAALYDPASIEIRRDRLPEPGELPASVRESFVEARRIRSWRKTPREDPETWMRQFLHHYYAVVSQIDDAVGEIVKRIDLERTLALFTSDHGHYLGWRGLVSKEPFIGFEPVGRVPFFAFGHGVPRGLALPQPVSLGDVAPTLLTAAGVPVPPDLDGRPLQDYFADSATGRTRAVFCRGTAGVDVVRRGPYKYFRSRDRSAEMLFDVSRDPDERENLAAHEELQAVRQQLSAEMDAIWARPGHGLPRFAGSPTAKTRESAS